MAIGYVILNEENTSSPVVCSEGGLIYRDRSDVEREARRLRRNHHSKEFNVYELADPGIVYMLNEEDVFEIARQKRVGKKKVQERMESIQKGISDGFYNWGEIVEYAIDAALVKNNP